MSKKKKRLVFDYLKIIFILIVLTVVLFLIFKPIFINDIFPKFKRRINATTKGADLSVQARYKQPYTAINQLLTDGNLINYFLDFGNGAFYKIKYCFNGKADNYCLVAEKNLESFHTIHNTWATFLFRTGLIGLFLFLLLCLSFIKKLFDCISQNNAFNLYLKVLFILLIFKLFIGSWGSYIFWQDIQLGVIMIMVGHMLRRIDSNRLIQKA